MKDRIISQMEADNLTEREALYLISTTNAERTARIKNNEIKAVENIEYFFVRVILQPPYPHKR